MGFARFSEARMKDPVDGTAKIVSISMPSADATSNNYQMDAVVSGPGIEPTAVHHTGGSAPVDRWPSPGDEIPIVIDRKNPSHFVIEWKKLPRWQDQSKLAAAALASQMRAGTDGTAAPAVAVAEVTPAKVSSADVLARGIAGSATVLGTFPTGQPAPDADHTIIGLMLNVMIDGHPPYQVQAMYNTPTAKVEKLAPGALLPVKADPNQLQLVAVDWAAVSA
jgi:hypothetical protein